MIAGGSSGSSLQYVNMIIDYITLEQILSKPSEFLLLLTEQIFIPR